MTQAGTAVKKRRGIIFIISAPSGAGKTTLIAGLRSVHPELSLSVSFTTRERRNGEVDGVDYQFIGRRRFEAMKAKGDFAEWARVHDFLYGTPRRPLERSIRKGRDVLLDIDVQGAKKIKKAYPGAVSIFLLPPSLGELKRRLALRGTDGDEAIRRRLANAQGEIREILKYDYYVVNQDVAEAVALLTAIVKAERARTSRVTEWRIEPLRKAAKSS